MKKTTKAKPQRKSKGKQHPLHAETLDQLADRLESNYTWLSAHQLSVVLRDECKRVRGILR